VVVVVVLVVLVVVVVVDIDSLNGLSVLAMVSSWRGYLPATGMMRRPLGRDWRVDCDEEEESGPFQDGDERGKEEKGEEEEARRERIAAPRGGMRGNARESARSALISRVFAFVCGEYAPGQVPGVEVRAGPTSIG